VNTAKATRRHRPGGRRKQAIAPPRLSDLEIAKLAAAIAALLKGSAGSPGTAATVLKPPPELQDWNSVDQLEAISGISKWTWRRWAQDGKVSSAKVSSRLLISRGEYLRVMSDATRPRKE
jgi:hypothetical protein